MKKTLFLILASLALLMGAGFSKAGADEASWTTQSEDQTAPLMFAKASAMQEVKIASTESTAEDSDGSGIWISGYAGYDYANMGDLADAVKNLHDALPGLGDMGPLYADHSGILAGGDLGYSLDKTSSIFLSVEGVWTSRQGVTITSGPDAGFSEFLDPNVMNVSLNYSLALVNNKGGKTTISVGSGVYIASIHFTENGGGGDQDGNFGQTNIGGTLGISEELFLGAGFALDCGVRFRAADFGKLTTTNYRVGGVEQTGGPFVLVDSPDITPIPTSLTLPGIHDADMDYTGMDADLGLTLAL
jgi:hypothetical protein